MERTLALPDLFCPFEPETNPFTDSVQGASVGWVSRFGLLQDEQALKKFAATNLAGLAGRFHPEAAEEELRLVSDFYSFMFVRDDRLDQAAFRTRADLIDKEDARSLAALSGERPHDDEGPFARAMADLARRFDKRASGGRMGRLSRAVRRHFAASVWEATNRSRGEVPHPKAYVRMRRLTSGIPVDLALLEVLGRLIPPPHALSDPAFGEMTDAANDAICFANDLFSLSKELAKGDVHNLVVVLAHSEGLTLERAVLFAGEEHDRVVGRFLELEADLRATGRLSSAPLVGYLPGYVLALKRRMAGNLDWTRSSARYHARHDRTRPEAGSEKKTQAITLEGGH